MSDVTQLLNAIDASDPKAADQLLPLVYDELRKLAAHRITQEKPGQTLQATALVHEAWLRLVGPEQQSWDSRGHFFAAAAEAMRRILVENARRKSRQKRGGSWERVNLEDLQLAIESDPATLLSIDEALAKLKREFPEKAELVKLRFFAGLSLPEAARTLRISDATAKRHWAFARAWLYEQLEGESGEK